MSQELTDEEKKPAAPKSTVKTLKKAPDPKRRPVK